MHRIHLLLACTGCLFALACSNTSSSGSSGGNDAAVDNDAGAGCVAYVSDASLTTPIVSFQTDILPVFETSCGVGGATCHGATNETTLDRPYLGTFDGDGGESAAILSGIVGVAASEDPTMDVVKAGSPDQSYLMYKLDDDQCLQAADCAPQQATIAAINPGLGYSGCGTVMPQTGVQLEASMRDTIRRWIAQGAKSN
jgi:hypothetical protein